jgi:protein-disulfide isomerase
MKLISRLRFVPLALAIALSFFGCKPQPQDMEKAIGDYLQQHPQVIQKAVQDAMKTQARPRPPEPPLEEKIKNAIQVDLNNAPTEGPANAPITIVEFSDFQCPFCGRVVPTIKQLMKDYNGKVQLAFRMNPLPFHQFAPSAAKAALAAKDQGKFWQMHDLLFENQKDLSDDSIRKLAQQAGLNMTRFEKDWKSTKYDALLVQDMDFAKNHGASGTPAFFINGVLVSGAQPIDNFRVVINKLLSMKGLPGYTPPETKPQGPGAAPPAPGGPQPTSRPKG